MTVKAIFYIVLLMLFGCTSPNKNMVKKYSEAGHVQSQVPYKIQPGDLLDVKFFYNSELNEQVTVRSDGMISLQLIPEVTAAGMTPTELSDYLNDSYSSEIVDPKITVIVRAPISEKVYVDGEVNRAGLITINGTLTVLQSIAQAGGMKDTADPKSVLIIRRVFGEKIRAMSVNVDGIRKSGSSGDVVLLPNDIVYVPRSSISDLNAWIDLYIRKNIPLPVGLGYSIR